MMAMKVIVLMKTDTDDDDDDDDGGDDAGDSEHGDDDLDSNLCDDIQCMCRINVYSKSMNRHLGLDNSGGMRFF